VRWCPSLLEGCQQSHLTRKLGLDATVASLALTAFWAVVTAGRVLFGAIHVRFPSRRTYHLLPFVLAAAFLLIGGLPQNAPVPRVLAFAQAGEGCSALLPLTISIEQEELAAVSDAVAGGVIARYQIRYGLAAFGVGLPHVAGVALPAIFAASASVAATLGILSFSVARRRPSHTVP
jgi:predicted MFS family arabinose efflux permease